MDYHALSGKEVVEKFNSSVRGLNNEEVNLRLKKYGKNQLKRVRHFNALKIFLIQFKSFLIIMVPIFLGRLSLDQILFVLLNFKPVVMTAITFPLLLVMR